MIGIIGPPNDSTRSLVAEQLATTSVETTVSTNLPNDTSRFTALYLIGIRALSQCASTRPDCHLIPINTLPIPQTLSPAKVPESLQQLETNEYTERALPTIALTQANQHITTGLFDLFISPNQVAEITTFAITTDTLDTEFRADGIATGTPIGTNGFLQAAGAPIVDYDTEAIITVPLAQFDLEKSHWVFSPETTITIDVIEASSPILALTDGTATHTIDVTQPLSISLTHHLTFTTFPTSPE